MSVKKSTASKGLEGNKMVTILLVLLSLLCGSVTPTDPYGAEITIPVTRGQDVIVAFDPCSVIDSGGNRNSWRGYDIYMSVFTPSSWCDSWSSVLWTTKPMGVITLRSHLSRKGERGNKSDL